MKKILTTAILTLTLIAAPITNSSAATIYDSETNTPLYSSKEEISDLSSLGNATVTPAAKVEFDPLPYLVLTGGEIEDWTKGAINGGGILGCSAISSFWGGVTCSVLSQKLNEFLESNKDPDFDRDDCYEWKAFNVPPEKTDREKCQ